MVRLVIHQQNHPAPVELKNGVYRVGRQKPADIVIPDATISSSHAELQVDGEICMLRDLGSRNGTFINEKPVSNAIRIKPSDQVRLGAIRLAIEIPREVKPVAAQPAGLPGPTAKMEAVKVASSKLRWTWRYWIAGAEAIIALLLLFAIVIIYTESATSGVRLTNRFKALAAQYVHILSQPEIGALPAPITDESLQEPIMIADRNGEILHPPLPADATEAARKSRSPLIDSKTGKVKPEVRWGLATLEIPGRAGPTVVRSYPVQIGGRPVGYVIARPAADPESVLGQSLLMLAVAGLIGLMFLYFVLAPVHRMVREQMNTLRLKISPLFNGFIDELPRSGGVPELGAIAEEIEKSFTSTRLDAERAGARGAGKQKLSELAPLLGDLLDSASVPYCFIDGDFKIVLLAPTIREIGELARAVVGTSLFDAGMTNIQSKLLVQTITEARKGEAKSVRVTLSRRGTPTEHEVTARVFPQSGGKVLYGVIFGAVAA